MFSGPLEWVHRLFFEGWRCQTYTHTRICTYTHTHTCICTYTLKHTHTYTHMYIQTETHTHTLPAVLQTAWWREWPFPVRLPGRGVCGRRSESLIGPHYAHELSERHHTCNGNRCGNFFPRPSLPLSLTNLWTCSGMSS